MNTELGVFKTPWSHKRFNRDVCKFIVWQAILFTGDLTWAAKAFIGPSEKHAIPGGKVDGDREKVKESIVMVHHRKKRRPELKIIPAHDFNEQIYIAHFPCVEW